MPRVVDHERRREEIARLVIEEIRSAGLENATMRRIARGGGFTIGVLAHYFRDKDQMVRFAFDWLARQSFAELDTATSSAPEGRRRVRAAIEYMVPEPGAASFIAVWLGLWSAATRNPALSRTHANYYAEWRKRLRQYLQQARRRGEFSAPHSIADATDILVAAVDGLWLGSAFEPERLSRRRRTQLLERLLSLTLGESTHSRPRG
jgi:AcrR family transcriptional regulator